LDTHPKQDEVLETSRAIVDLCFSHRLDPESVRNENLRLRSGNVFYDAGQKVELLNWRDRGSEEIADDPWCPGSVLRLDTGGYLPAGVSYRVVMYEGLRAWTGETLDTSGSGWVHPTEEPVDTDSEPDPEDLEPRWILNFAISSEAPVPEDPPEPPPPPSLETLFEAGAVFDPAASACACHNLEGQLANELLDLSGPGVAYEDLVQDTRLRSSGFPMVTPGDAAASFLVQKLVQHDGRALPGVFGDPMPPQLELEPSRVGAISAWIDGGALP
jgi:hypothetical protein